MTTAWRGVYAHRNAGHRNRRTQLAEQAVSDWDRLRVAFDGLRSRSSLLAAAGPRSAPRPAPTTRRPRNSPASGRVPDPPRRPDRPGRIRREEAGGGSMTDTSETYRRTTYRTWPEPGEIPAGGGTGPSRARAGLRSGNRAGGTSRRGSFPQFPRPDPPMVRHRRSSPRSPRSRTRRARWRTPSRPPSGRPAPGTTNAPGTTPTRCLRNQRLVYGYLHMATVKPALNYIEWATESELRAVIHVLIAVAIWLGSAAIRPTVKEARRCSWV